MKTLKRWIPLFSALLLCGCFQVEDELTLAPDGSGKVTMKVHSSLSQDQVSMMGMTGRFGGGEQLCYPPISEAEARRFFPAKDFALKVEETSADDGQTLAIEASFKDVNALLASPYARAHQLMLGTNESGALALQALSGGGMVAAAMQFKLEGEMAAFEMPGLEEAQKKKSEMRFAFRVTLPNPVTSANGTREDKSAAWTVERAKFKDDEEFAGKLAEVLEASCSSQGIKFSPVTPPRLALLPFDRLAAGSRAAAAALPDTNKVLEAAHFVPWALQVTRTLDLSGEGSGQASSSQLTGAITLPADLAPQRWGQAQLEEVVDSKGNSLMPGDDTQSMAYRMRSFSMTELDESEQPDEDEPESASPKPAADKPHMVTFTFKAPEWKMKEIARIKGGLDLQYLGGSEVVKLSNAVPASQVMDLSKGGFSAYNFEPDRKPLSDSRLAELGLSVQVQMAMVQSGATILSLQVRGGKGTLVDAQVFDASGHPWPTTLTPSDFGGSDESCQIVVAGKPQPPFSLAFVASGVGALVHVPVLVENVPLGEK
jgi:hypothetical protein